VGTKPPKTFVQIDDTSGISWRTLELRSDLQYEQAWQTLVDVVALRWDIETMDKDAGYLRSSWSYLTTEKKTGQKGSLYGRRLTAKFNEARTVLSVKTEAFFQIEGDYRIFGIDSAFNDDVFTEISGKLGRTAG
jgi:hypothetical protein